jgi:Tol biopolymer transport system component
VLFGLGSVCACCVALTALLLRFVPEQQAEPSVPLAQECSPDVSPPAGDRIVFTSQRDGHEEIYSMNGDGSDQQRLTNSLFYATMPYWSADGKKIFFLAHLGPDSTNQGEFFTPFELMMMNADGNGQEKVTDQAAPDIDGYPSPDGKLIVSDDGTNIFVTNADGSGRRQLTSETQNSYPSWSPDGSLIAFVSITGGSESPMFTFLYIIRPDGTGLTKLIDNVFSYPSWSPDGTRIAILGGNISSEGYFYVIKADGTGAVRISNGGALNSPVWSPDGEWLAFDTQGVSDSLADIAVAKSTCAGFWRLTNTLESDYDPEWQPK